MNRMIYDLQINKLNYQLLDKTAASEARRRRFSHRTTWHSSLTIELKQTNRLGDMIHMSHHNSCGFSVCARSVPLRASMCVSCEICSNGEPNEVFTQSLIALERFALAKTLGPRAFGSSFLRFPVPISQRSQ